MKKGFLAIAIKDIRRNKILYILSIPIILWYLIFCYRPMVGVLMVGFPRSMLM